MSLHEGSEILDSVDPSDLSNPMTAVAVCYRCVTEVAESVEPLRDIQNCKSVACSVWEARRKAMKAIGPNK